jgi:sugar (pentulose or hexulose) kinase
MTHSFIGTIGRRDVLLALTGAATGAVAASSLAPAEAASERKTANGKARYQPNSADVQNFYRVNR